MLEVVERYTELKPENELEKYIPALEQVNGTDSHDGLGNAFEKAWVDEQNMNVVLRYAKKDGLTAIILHCRWNGQCTESHIVNFKCITSPATEILTNSSYHFDVVCDHDKFIGEILYWNIGEYVYEQM